MEWGLNNQAWARLDRFLVSPSWLDQFSGVTQGRLSRPTSDHFPIVLEGGGVRRGPTPFRGSASYRLAVKMKEIKKKLKVWNKEADIGSIQVGCISQQEAESLETPFAEIEIPLGLDGDEWG
ncbi:hypothetical protein CK203_079169 [Vitis vinifera]|uniref:Endonuclease/exonuclease/phosphatase domain-containing protein n=1 Tax=Vitis vinifera TaxID=29760 RepID=A0A438DYX3_VITVI|nr:hypothetical protein CK203_079169 [Vitis vinifera]